MQTARLHVAQGEPLEIKHNVGVIFFYFSFCYSECAAQAPARRSKEEDALYIVFSYLVCVLGLYNVIHTDLQPARVWGAGKIKIKNDFMYMHISSFCF